MSVHLHHLQEENGYGLALAKPEQHQKSMWGVSGQLSCEYYTHITLVKPGEFIRWMIS